jgi:hypothetical protein
MVNDGIKLGARRNNCTRMKLEEEEKKYPPMMELLELAPNALKRVAGSGQSVASASS